MFSWLKDRLSEKSTWLGLTGVLGVASQITSTLPNQANSAELLGQAANAVSQVGAGIVAGDYTGATVAGVSAALAMVAKEKGKRNA